MRYFINGFFFSMLVIFTACKSTQPISKAIAPVKPEVSQSNADDSIKRVQETVSRFKSGKIAYKTFNAKIKIESSGTNGKNPDLTAVVRIIRDSAIWVSLSATFVNIEVYRLLIKKDSVILLNKQDKEVHYRTLDYLQEVTKIPFDFITLQDLIVGNPVFIGDSITSFRQTENMILFSCIEKYFKNLFTISGQSGFMLHSKLDDLDHTRNRTADITYDNYDSTSGVNFSTERRIIVSEKNSLDIRLGFKQYEFNKELSVTLNVPPNYKIK